MNKNKKSRRPARSYTTLTGLVLAASLLVTESHASLNDEIAQARPTDMLDKTVVQQWQPHQGSDLAIWQGFDHNWLRYVGLPEVGATAHRISRLHSSLIPAQAGEPARARMAQRTGVEGNYMRPRAYYTNIPSAGYEIHHGKTQLTWADTLNEATHPEAVNRFWVTVLPPPNAARGADALLLSGVELDVTCDDRDQRNGAECSADGIWPHFFRINLQHCQGQAFQEGACLLQVDIYRGWTPLQGGLPLAGFSNQLVVPQNYRHRYQLGVRYTTAAAIDASRKPVLLPAYTRGSTLHDDLPATTRRIAAPARSDAVVGLTGFGFRMTRPNRLSPQWLLTDEDLGFRGRYIRELDFAVGNAIYRWLPNMLEWQQQQTVFSPPSVVDSGLETELTAILLPVGSVGKLGSPKVAEGRLCTPTISEALTVPWAPCGKPLLKQIYGEMQTEDIVVLQSGTGL